jgi:hypothetical protein
MAKKTAKKTAKKATKRKKKAAARKGAAVKSAKKRAAARKATAARRAPSRSRAAGAPRDFAQPGALAGGATKKEVEIGEFFQRVAAGLVDAQRTLDDQSLAYLTATANQPHVIPSVFRIPKLSADISFALEDVEKDKVSLVFWGNTSEARTLHQQSIHFELVSAPPSPDFSGTALLLQLLLSRPLRDPVLTAATPKPWTDETRDEVLIFQLLDDHFVIAFADPASPELTLLYARRDAPGTGVIRARAVVPAELRGFYEALRELARRQRPLLS